jgi:preprotein translocase subunit SecY|tara:strand:- start:265 stop:1536 length:1272 start_codon:yes stop_codon:yes gene_type:complete
MEKSTTRTQLKNKIVKILTLLLLVRLGLYIPVPGLDLDIFAQNQNLNPMFGFAKTLLGNSFIGIGSLGILPYINASIIIQLLTPVIPSMERLQKEEGEIGRQQITRYTRYLTFGWAIALSFGVANFLIKPVMFNWSLFLGFKIVLALTIGSLLSMWFAELITEEGLGNGSSMIIFINIVGSIPNNIINVVQTTFTSSLTDNLFVIFKVTLIYLFIVLVIITFQDAYKKVNIVSAKQLSLNPIIQSTQSSEFKNSFIPLKLNQGGVMPLVFSSTIAILLVYPVQQFINLTVGANNSFWVEILQVYSFGANLILVVFFSCFYVSLVLKPKDMSENLGKMAYNIPGIRQGKETTKYLEKTINRLAFIGGLFLAFLAFFPLLIGNVFQFTFFKNLTSLLILIGVITDTTSQIRGYLISSRYEGFKKT